MTKKAPWKFRSKENLAIHRAGPSTDQEEPTCPRPKWQVGMVPGCASREAAARLKVFPMVLDGFYEGVAMKSPCVCAFVGGFREFYVGLLQGRQQCGPNRRYSWVLFCLWKFGEGWGDV